MRCEGDIKSIAQTPDGKTLAILILLTHPENVEGYTKYHLDISLDKHREHRSKQANSFLWACIKDIANATYGDKDAIYYDLLRHYGQYTLVRIPKDALDLLKRQWKETEVVGEVDGKLDVLCYFGSHTYNSKEFARLLEGVKDMMRSAGLVPPPDERMRSIIDGLD